MAKGTAMVAVHRVKRNGILPPGGRNREASPINPKVCPKLRRYAQQRSVTLGALAMFAAPGLPGGASLTAG